MRDQFSRSFALKFAFGLLVTVAFLASCNKSDHSPLPSGDPTSDTPGQTTTTCVDADQDGFGTGCLAGPDCDDKNASITNECYRCDTPNDGCPCPTEGKVVQCGSEASREGDRVTCVVGDRTCTGGKWDSCVAKTMTTMSLSRSRMQPLAVATNPAACLANICDPFCHHYDNSVPPALDTNSTTDGGITLLNGAGGSAAGGAGGAGGATVCSNVSQTAVRFPIGVLTTVQLSNDMAAADVTTVRTQLNSFYASPTTNGMTMGFDTFPCPSCSATSGCHTDDECCATNYDDTSGGVTATKPPDYLTVQMQPMPGAGNAHRTAMTNAVTSLAVTGSVPMLAALSGALDAAWSWGTLPANLAVKAKPVVVLVADKLPNACGVCGGKKGKSAKNQSACRVQEVAAVAEQYFFDPTLSVTTLVVGVKNAHSDNMKYLDTIARAGSGGKYGVIVADTSAASSILNALNQVRDEELSCDYPVPLPPTGTGIIDPSTTTVTYTNSVAPITTSTLTRVNALGDCTAAGGFFYDASGPKVTLCPTTCTTAENDLNATINVTYSCKSSCSSQSAEAQPGPLDILFLMDRSKSMATDLNDSSGADVGVTAWNAAQTAIRNFIRDPDVAGLEVGLSYFPLPSGCATCRYCTNLLGGTCACGGFGCNMAAAPVPWPFCPTQDVAGVEGDCVDNGSSPPAPAVGRGNANYEYFANEAAAASACVTANYAPTLGLVPPAAGLGVTQGVDFGVIPGSGANPFWQSIFSSFDRVIPDTGTSKPVVGALKGAINYASAHEAANPTHKTVVVLVTSGIPSVRLTSDCTSTTACLAGQYCATTLASDNTPAKVYAKALAALGSAAALGHAAGIDTYVIGVGAAAASSLVPADLTTIQTNGTGSATPAAFAITDASDPSAFATAMNTIRRQAMNCNFAVPTPSSGTLDTTPANVAVHLTATVLPAVTAADYTLSNVAATGACGANQSWYYDNNTTPTLINLCGTPCTNLRADPNARVDISYQCVPPPPPPPPPVSYSPGVATFEFDATGVCASDQQPLWADFSYQATTPGDSKVSFVIATGTRDSTGTISGLSADVPLQFTKTSLAGKPACAAAWTSGPADSCGNAEDTQVMGPQFGALRPGDIFVDTTLQGNAIARNLNYVRIKATLTPTSDQKHAPKITNWDLQVSCITSQ